MTSNILDPSVLIATLPKLLPISKKQLESPQDALAALVHTILSVLAFRLVAVDDNAPAHDVPDGVLLEEWTSHAPSHYTLRYKHEQSSLQFIVKVSKLGSRTLVNAIAAEVRFYRNINCIVPSHVFYRPIKRPPSILLPTISLPPHSSPTTSLPPMHSLSCMASFLQTE